LRRYRVRAGWQVKFCASQHQLEYVILVRLSPTRSAAENNKPMPDTNAPPRRDDDEDDAPSAEARMRLALGQLGTRALPGRSGPSSPAPAIQSGPQRRTRFARDGEVPVERVPPPARSPADLQRELGEERAGRGRAEQALQEAQATVATLQAALAQADQAARTARAAVQEREAAMAGLRIELARGAAERDALLDAQATRITGNKPKRAAAASKPQRQEPEPARWWLDYLKTSRP